MSLITVLRIYFLCIEGNVGTNFAVDSSPSPYLHVSGLDTEYPEFLVVFLSSSKQMQRWCLKSAGVPLF